MATTKLQTAAIAIAACLLITIPVAVAVIHHNASPAPVAARAADLPAPEPAVEDPASAYALKPGQLITHFPNPPAEVHDIYERPHHPRGQLGQRGHLVFAYSDDGTLHERGYMTGSLYTVRSLLGTTAGINPQDIDSSSSFGPTLWPLSGDVVYRPGAKPEEYVAALQQLVQTELHIKATMTLRNADHRVIVLRGTWTHDEMLDEKPRKPEIRLAQGDVPADGIYPKYPTAYYGGVNDQAFAAAVGTWIDEPVVVEAKGFPKSVELKYYEAPISDFAAHLSSNFKEHLFGQITQQTGLTWSEEIRNVRRLVVDVAK